MLKIAEIFQSGMLLQRCKYVRVWGTGTPDDKIQVTIQDRNAETVVNAEGKWELTIPPLKESYKEQLSVQGKDERIELEDIAVGEVFVAAGQSNMEFWMKYEKHYQKVLAGYDNPNIRFYDMPKLSYAGQEKDFNYHNVGIWRKALKEELKFFSAVGYYFAEKLEKDLSVPVGIIGCNWGGTKSLAWMEENQARELQKEQTEDFEKKLCGQSYEEFCQMAGRNPANDTGNSVWNPFNEFILPRTPSWDEIISYCQQNAMDGTNMIQAKPQDAPGVLYRYMVQRLAPYTVRGILWYQGESDDEIAGTQQNYKTALNAIKSDWRAAWDDPHLPFFVVQLPGFCSWMVLASQGYHIIRECQQTSVDEDTDAFLCSISDAGEEMDIHPKNKKVVGERLALLVEKHVFGKDILADAPRMKKIEREENKIIISYDNAEGGLYLKGSQINALTVESGEQEIDYTAELSGTQVILTLPDTDCSNFTVKFARTQWYQVNLYNKAGVPAIPFEATC